MPRLLSKQLLLPKRRLQKLRLLKRLPKRLLPKRRLQKRLPSPSVKRAVRVAAVVAAGLAAVAVTIVAVAPIAADATIVVAVRVAPMMAAKS